MNDNKNRYRKTRSQHLNQNGRQNNTNEPKNTKTERQL